ncbi:MAG: serine protease [Meiothermus sp.]
MRRSWLVLGVVAYLGGLAAVIHAQAVNPPPKVLTPEIRKGLESLYSEAKAAAVRIETIPEGTGSGFFISADGLVMTAYHVVRDAASFRVVTTKGQSLPASVVGYDEYHDIALLRAKASGPLPFLELDTSHNPKAGDGVLAIGNSRGEFIAPRYGLVTSVDRDIFPFFNSVAVSSTLPLAPGDSGGPVINEKGKAVAVVIAIGVSDGVFESYLSPLYNQDELLAGLQAGRKHSVPYIGVALFQIDDDTATLLKIPKEGVLVRDLLPGGAAQKAGLRPFVARIVDGKEVYDFDVILKADGRSFDDVQELQRYVRSKNVGDTVTLTIRRGKETVEVKVVLAPNPENRT